MGPSRSIWFWAPTGSQLPRPAHPPSPIHPVHVDNVDDLFGSEEVAPIVSPSSPMPSDLDSNASGSPRPKIRDSQYTPLPRTEPPEWHPDVKWWAGPVFDYFVGLMKSFPRAPRRRIMKELMCAGTCGELQALTVPKAIAAAQTFLSI